eukprot:5403284-Prymnesium_polylepis.1
MLVNIVSPQAAVGTRRVPARFPVPSSSLFSGLHPRFRARASLSPSCLAAPAPAAAALHATTAFRGSLLLSAALLP